MKLFNQKQLAITLMALGAAPFVALTALILLAARPGVLPASPAAMLHGYAVLIASFVAGLHWGVHFCKRTSDSLYLISSGIVLMLWYSMSLVGTARGFATVLLGFVLLWVVEYRLSAQRVTTAWFWRVRNWVSGLVTFCLLAVILATA